MTAHRADGVNAGLGRARILSTAAAIVLLTLGLVLAMVHVGQYRLLSPIDEWAHIDYLYKAADGSIVRRGDLLGQGAMRELACRGIDAEFGEIPCRPGGTYHPSEFYNLKHSQADHNPPTYYWLTAAAGRVVMGFGEDNLVDAGRVVGGLWLGLGLLVFWLAARRLQISPLARGALIVLMGVTPAVVHASSTINTDATSLLAGSLVALGVIAWEERSIPAWLLAPASAFAVGTKVTGILPVLAAVAYLLIRGFARTRPVPDPKEAGGLVPNGDRQASLRAAAILLGGAAASLVVWLLVHRAIQRVAVSPLIAFHRVESLSLGTIFDQSGALITPIRGPHLPPFLERPDVEAIVQLFNVVLIAAAFGVFLWRVRVGRTEAWAMASGIVMLTGGMALTLANFLTERIFFPIPARYGLGLLPMLSLGLGGALRRPTVLWLVTALAAVSGGVLAHALWVA